MEEYLNKAKFYLACADEAQEAWQKGERDQSTVTMWVGLANAHMRMAELEPQVQIKDELITDRTPISVGEGDD